LGEDSEEDRSGVVFDEGGVWCRERLRPIGKASVSGTTRQDTPSAKLDRILRDRIFFVVNVDANHSTVCDRWRGRREERGTTSTIYSRDTTFVSFTKKWPGFWIFSSLEWKTRPLLRE
jgi:hypothetical protein